MPNSTTSETRNEERYANTSTNGVGGPAHRTFHEIGDTLLVEISGEGGRSVDELRSMYDRFRVSDPDSEPDLRVELDDEKPDADVVLGWPSNNYGRDGDRFVIERPTGWLSADQEWRHLRTAPDWEPYHTVYVIEFELRRRMATEGWALMHGCGFRFDGRTVLCPSLRGAGKTNTLLTMLQAGAAYLSDDRVWVDGSGTVRGYPVPVNPHAEQYESFPGLTEPDRSPRERAFRMVEEHADPTRSILDKGILFLVTQLLATDRREFHDVEELMADATYVAEEETDRVALLRAAPDRSRVSVEDISGRSMSRALRMIHHYEWNGQLEEYFLAFDSLFPGGDMSERLDQLRTDEERIFEELLGSVPTDQVNVPRERNWRESGVSDDILGTFETLTEAPRQSPRR